MPVAAIPMQVNINTRMIASKFTSRHLRIAED